MKSNRPTPPLAYWSIALTLVLIGAAMWVLNYLTPEVEDDNMYKFLFSDGSFDLSRPIRNFHEVLVSQYHHYFSYNGRTLVHILLQSFTSVWGKPVFNICNAAVFSLFVYLLTRLTSAVRPFNILFTCTVIFFLFPVFGRIFLWMAGSINYLWTSAIICLWLIGLKRLKQVRLSGHHAWYGILSFFVGWTHEGIAMPLAMSLIVYLIVHRRTICHAAVFPAAIGFIAGACVCTFSSGTLGRLPSEDTMGWITLAHRANSMLTVCCKLKVFPVLLLVVAGACLMRTRRWFWLKTLYKRNLLLCNAVVFSFGVVFLSGFAAVRCAIGVELFALILLLRMIAGCDWRRMDFLKRIAVVGGGILYVFICYYSVLNYRSNRQILLQIKNNKSDLIVFEERQQPAVMSTYVLGITKDFSPDNYWNQLMVVLFHRERLAFVEANVYDDILAHSETITNVSQQGAYPYYVLPVDSAYKDRCPFFVLQPVDRHSLPFYIRPFASKLDRYTATEIPVTTGFDVLNIDGQDYLFVHKNRMVDARVKTIRLK